MKKLFFALLLTPLFIACKKDSSKVDQNKIYQSLSIIYNAELDETTVTAKFTEEKESGKNLELSGSSKVTFNGSQLSISGSVYTQTFDGLINSGTFVFTDTNGKTYTNTILGEQYIGNDNSYYISNTSSSTWYFDGASVQTGETASVSLSSSASSGGSASSSTSTVGSIGINMTVSNLQGINDGLGTAVTSRSSETTSGDWTSVGGLKTSTYRSTKSVIEIY